MKRTNWLTGSCPKRRTSQALWRPLSLGLALVLLLGACSDLTTPPMAVTPTKAAETAAPAQPTPTPEPTAVPLAARVNGAPILLADYERQVERYEASMTAAGQDPSTEEGQVALAQGRQWVLDMMIDQVLIEQAAAEAGVTVSDDEVEATIESLRQEIGEDEFAQWLEDEGMSLDEMRERLRSDMVATQMANRIAESVPSQAEHVHARHILLNTEEEAEQILSQLQAGADFVSLARAHSQDTSTRDTGGDLGFFPPGVLTSPEVEATAFALQPGQISEVVQSALGYHVVQVVERQPDMEITSENLRILRDEAVGQWLEDLRASAEIQYLVSETP